MCIRDRAHLVALAGEADAVACRRGPRLEPLVAVYRRAPVLAAARSRLAGPPGGHSFDDLDDPADLAAWDPGAR